MSAAGPLALCAAVATALERVAVDPALSEASADVLKIAAAWIREIRPAPVPIDLEVAVSPPAPEPMVLVVRWSSIERVLGGVASDVDSILIPDELVGTSPRKAYREGYQEAWRRIEHQLRELLSPPVRG